MTTSELQNTLWWARRGQPPAVNPLAHDLQVDVAVIGGGFTGLTAALHLARRGARVAVLEARTIGSGASGLNAGFVVPSFAKADPATVIARLGEARGRKLLEMIGQGADRVFSTVREHGIACDAEQTGWMNVAHTADMLEVLRVRAEAWKRLGRPVRILEQEEARERTSLRHCAGALLDESGGVLDPLAYTHGLARAALAAGADLFDGAAIDRIDRRGSHWELSSGSRRVQAGKVLLCTNATRHGVAGRLFNAIVPLRVYQIATQTMPAEVVRRISPQRNPVADTRANLFTYRLTADNRIVSGAMAILPLGAHRRMARYIVERLAAELELPFVPQAEHVWRGIAAMTPDFLPHLYEFGPNFVGGIGCNGRGVALTAMLGEVMADAAMGRPLADLPVPVASTRGIPFHAFAQAAPSVAIAQARLQDALSLRQG
ncbi:MAG TPA: FAD-binding oxidoreductase [Ramlibacter sp.]|nr:FAD-binding oxidoreductase [Ramlibacter sp.]